jgi:hypothetical protein
LMGALCTFFPLVILGVSGVEGGEGEIDVRYGWLQPSFSGFLCLWFLAASRLPVILESGGRGRLYRGLYRSSAAARSTFAFAFFLSFYLFRKESGAAGGGERAGRGRYAILAQGSGGAHRAGAAGLKHLAVSATCSGCATR